MEIGKSQKLKVAREVDFGVYLTDGKEDILLPAKYVPNGTQVGDELNVFVYIDSLGRPVSVTKMPLAQLDDVVCLRVKQVTSVGAFADIGLEKDLLIPFREQQTEMLEGRKYVVKVILDHRTDRLIGTTKIAPFLSKDGHDLEEGERVQVLIWQRTELGFKVIVNDQYQGLIFHNEIFESVAVGDRKEAFVKRVREDGKIDIALQQQGYQAVKDMSQIVLNKVKMSGGRLALGDKSSPEEIKEELGMSKKNFKKILGGLYKAGQIEITDFEIVLKAEG